MGAFQDFLIGTNSVEQERQKMIDEQERNDNEQRKQRAAAANAKLDELLKQANEAGYAKEATDYAGQFGEGQGKRDWLTDKNVDINKLASGQVVGELGLSTQKPSLGQVTDRLALYSDQPNVRNYIANRADEDKLGLDQARLDSMNNLGQKKIDLQETPEERAAREQNNFSLKAQHDKDMSDLRVQHQKEVESLKSQLNGGRGGSSNGVSTVPNAEDDKIATDLAFAKLTPQAFKGMYSKFKGNDERMRKVYLLAREKNPDFDQATYEADFASYKNNAQRSQMSNLTRAENLLDTYQTVSDAVKRGDVQGFNKATNAIGLQLSGIDQTNLKTLQTVMTEDLSRALTQSGATSDAKMKMAGDIADVMDVSNKAATSKIKILHEIIDANKRAIRDNWGVYGDKGKISQEDRPNAQNVTQQNNSTSQTKVINGVTYKKVTGGWEPQ